MSQDTQTIRLQDYHVTFGVQYRHEPHPVLSFPNLPDGYVTVEAPDWETARAVTNALFGDRYAFMYDAATHDTSYYPAGELARYGWLKDELAHRIMDRVRTHGAPIPMRMLPIAGIITEEANLHAPDQ